MIRPFELLVAVLTCAWLLLVGQGFAAGAQPDEVERQLAQAQTFYSEGRFDDAIATLRAVIARLEELKELESRKLQLADAHLLLGLAHLAMRREDEGLANFRQVVRLDPARRLDPEIFSPRVVAVFERARAESGPTGVTPAPPLASSTLGGSPETPVGSKTPPTVHRSLPPLNPGTRVRLGLRGGNGVVRGNLVSMSDTTFTVMDPDNQQSLSFPRDAVTRVDVLHRRRSHYLMGGLAGAGLGALIGALETPGCEGNDGDCYTRGENIAYGTLGFGIVGSLLGALYKTEEWVEVPLQPMAPTAARHSGGRIEVSFVVARWN